MVIGRRAAHVSEAKVREHVFGYTCANDMTARDLQKIDGQWTRAKSFDTFCPLGPHIETELEPQDLGVRLSQNGLVKQDSTTANMIFDVFNLVIFVSKIMTLFPGDVILTGTPPGVGPVAVGDELSVEIDGIGQLMNHVV